MKKNNAGGNEVIEKKKKVSKEKRKELSKSKNKRKRLEDAGIVSF